MMQGMVGGGINASRKTNCPAKIKSGPIFDAFQMLIFKDDIATAGRVHLEEYELYYPAGLQFCNMGGLHLVPPEFISWAIGIMEFIPRRYPCQC